MGFLNSFLHLFTRLQSKKKASSLVEVIVASVIIVIIFGIATLTLNNIIKNSYNTQKEAVINHLNKLEYLVNNNKINVPFQEEYLLWDIYIEYSKEQQDVIIFKAVQQQNNKEIIRRIYENNE